MFCIVTIFLLCFAKNGENRRMIGGKVDVHGEYHYVVKIGHRVLERVGEARRSDNLCNETSQIISDDCFMFRTDGVHDQVWKITRICTGSVINPKWTLTTGHCLPAVIDANNGAVIQYSEFSDYAMTRSTAIVEKVYYHPNTKIIDLNGFLQLYNDVGLMFHALIKLKIYGKLSAVETNSLFGQKTILAGLGNMRNGRETEELHLLEVVAKKCEDENLKIRVFPAICVARRCHVEGGICEGDTGGPLIHPSGIVGIGSLGLLNCQIKNTGFSGTVTALAPFLNWIQGIAKDKDIERRT